MRRRTLVRLFGPLMSIALVTAVTVVDQAPSQASPSSSAELLVSQGKAREAEGDEVTAIKRYSDALAMDPTAEGAYLALGALRAKRGELYEAEEVYALCVQRVPSSVDAVLARAHVRRLRGRLPYAADDLARAQAMIGHPATEREIALLREVVALKREQREPAAELAAWRRLLSIGQARVDGALVKEASLQARALGIFVGDIDPALRGRTETDLDRRTFASIARRGG